jgi:hypothetical protein
MRALWLSFSVLSLSGLLVSSVSSLPGCALPSSTTGTDAAAIPVTNGDAALTSTAMGTGCVVVAPNVKLCTGTSACPSITVDETVLPDCGFYFQGTSVYLACLCSGYLCPVGNGSAATCDQAASILASGTAGEACGEASNGECTAIESTSAEAGMSTDGGAEPPDGESSCSEACASMCAGVGPDCLEGCGC